MEYKEEILEKCLPKYLEEDLKKYVSSDSWQSSFWLIF